MQRDSDSFVSSWNCKNDRTKVNILRALILILLFFRELIWYVLYVNFYFLLSGMDLLSYKLHEPAYLIPVCICRIPLCVCGTMIDAIEYNLFALWMRKTYYFVIFACALVFFLLAQYSNVLEDNLYHFSFRIKLSFVNQHVGVFKGGVAISKNEQYRAMR